MSDLNAKVSKMQYFYKDKNLYIKKINYDIYKYLLQLKKVLKPQITYEIYQEKFKKLFLELKVSIDKINNIGSNDNIIETNYNLEDKNIQYYMSNIKESNL